MGLGAHAILALSYNLISQEKEQGTLAILMSQPIALKTLVLGKVGLRAAVVVLLAVGFSLAGFLASGGSLDACGALWRKSGLCSSISRASAVAIHRS